MAVVNPGEPVSTLRKALDAYTEVQTTMIEEAAKLKDPPPATTQSGGETQEGGATHAVPSGY